MVFPHPERSFYIIEVYFSYNKSFKGLIRLFHDKYDEKGNCVNDEACRCVPRKICLVFNVGGKFEILL